jgi:hypothetical protein
MVDVVGRGEGFYEMNILFFDSSDRWGLLSFARVFWCCWAPGKARPGLLCLRILTVVDDKFRSLVSASFLSTVIIVQLNKQAALMQHHGHVQRMSE